MCNFWVSLLFRDSRTLQYYDVSCKITHKWKYWSAMLELGLLFFNCENVSWGQGLETYFVFCYVLGSSINNEALSLGKNYIPIYSVVHYPIQLALTFCVSWRLHWNATATGGLILKHRNENVDKQIHSAYCRYPPTLQPPKHAYASYASYLSTPTTGDPLFCAPLGFFYILNAIQQNHIIPTVDSQCVYICT